MKMNIPGEYLRAVTHAGGAAERRAVGMGLKLVYRPSPCFVNLQCGISIYPNVHSKMNDTHLKSHSNLIICELEMEATLAPEPHLLEPSQMVIRGGCKHKRCLTHHIDCSSVILVGLTSGNTTPLRAVQ